MFANKVLHHEISAGKVNFQIHIHSYLSTYFLSQLFFSLAEVFPNLVTLAVWRTGLKTINDELMEKEGDFLKNLEEVNFRNNEIEFVMELAFKHVTKLKKIDLSMNMISTLDPKLFVTSSSLTMLILNNNRIVSLSEGLLTPLNPVSFINVNQNRVEVITLDFTSLPTLEIVLGVMNVCADFSMNKKKGKTALMLQELVVEKCSPKSETTTLQANETSTSEEPTTTSTDLIRTTLESVDPDVTTLTTADATEVNNEDSTDSIDEMTTETLPDESAVQVTIEDSSVTIAPNGSK